MDKKNIQETNFNSEQEHNYQSLAREKSMPTIKCRCGTEILVTPDLKAMDQAIKNHVTEHETASKSSENTLSRESLEQYLAEQVLIVTSKTKTINSK